MSAALGPVAIALALSGINFLNRDFSWLPEQLELRDGELSFGPGNVKFKVI